MKAVAARIKEGRKRKRMSLRQLGQKVGIAHSYVSKYEDGVVGEPRLSHLEGFAAALDMSLYELIGREAFEDDHRIGDDAEFRRMWEVLPADERGLVVDFMRMLRSRPAVDVGARVLGESSEGESHGSLAAG
ncbi:MAG: helix-turn-helix transcriptional regulator [Thermaceae bacterium]|nr:helix-turn-helix transcriptional regulator [Thermaceae bacterium]